MKKILVFLCFLSFCLALFAQKQICVDIGYTGSSQNGSPQSPYRSIQAAIDIAENGDSIKVAAGSYSAQALRILEKKIHLFGGYAGNKDFTFANPESNETILEGTKNAPCILIEIQGAAISGSMIISGFTIRNAQRGIELCGAWSGYLDNITIENNKIRNNGSNSVPERGGGIGLEGKNIRIQKNEISNNQADRGAAIGATSSHIENFLVSDNDFKDNKGFGDHGGAIIINGTGKISKNIFDGNSTANSDPSYGWGGAICIVNEDTTKIISLSGNIYRNNFAPDRGAALFVDEAAKVLMENELMYKNRSRKSGSAIYVDEHWDHRPSVLYMNNCTVSGNLSDEEGAAALFVQSSKAHVQNCIFWDNGSDFESIAGGYLSVEYSLTEVLHTGTGNISLDPLFADATKDDFHLKSGKGRYHSESNSWFTDDVHSPGIDAGKPSSDYSREPQPNGGRVNLGCYGNSPEASKSTSTAISAKGMQRPWALFPSPAKQSISLNHLPSGSNLRIIDVRGRLVYSSLIQSKKCEISTENFENGIYIVQVMNNGKLTSKKLLVNK